MNKPAIYTLNNRCVLGKLGPGSFEIEQPKCAKCNRTLVEEIDYSNVEYVFDSYNGEDMFSAEAVLIISKKLYTALEEKNIKGFAPVKVQHKFSKSFEGNKKELPEFIHLAVIPSNVNNIPIAYDIEETCDACGRGIMKFDAKRYRLNFRTETEGQLHLKVFYDSWRGADIFNFMYHGETGITQIFLDIIKTFNCPDNIIIPAEWI